MIPYRTYVSDVHVAVATGPCAAPGCRRDATLEVVDELGGKSWLACDRHAGCVISGIDTRRTLVKRWDRRRERDETHI